MSIYRLGDSVPIIDGDAWVHPEAVVLGDVRIGAGSSVWPGAVLRGDFGTIVVGARTSIQDNCTVHTASGRQTSIGDDCIVGHRAHLEDCTLDDAVLVGSGSIVLEVRIPTGAAVAAGAVVLAGTEIRPGHRAQTHT
jgi:carbonic anhydrase/acetyltransferase-like protein (isoleucine patch superfamily)